MEPRSLRSRSRLLGVVGRRASDGAISIGGSRPLPASLPLAASRLLDRTGSKCASDEVISI